jgi:hypothetical protein
MLPEQPTDGPNRNGETRTCLASEVKTFPKMGVALGRKPEEAEFREAEEVDEMSRKRRRQKR